ncbi:MAG: DUF1269 domain-containing protein [Gloeobacterales cyanobacterium]
MAITEFKRSLGTYSTANEVEHALTQLRDAGFHMNDVSILVKNDENEPDKIAGVAVKDTVGNQAGKGAATGAITGGTIGGITGLLVGIGALAIPGIGPVITAGATGTAIATALSGGAIGAAAGGLVGALVGLGIPRERAEVYDSVLRQGGYLVVVDGTQEELNEAHSILQHTNIGNYGVYDAPAGSYRERPQDHMTTEERRRNLGKTVEGQIEETRGRVTSDPIDQAEGRAKKQEADAERRMV